MVKTFYYKLFHARKLMKVNLGCNCSISNLREIPEIKFVTNCIKLIFNSIEASFEEKTMGTNSVLRSKEQFFSS